jgi:hypothetical protein
MTASDAPPPDVCDLLGVAHEKSGAVAPAADDHDERASRRGRRSGRVRSGGSADTRCLVVVVALLSPARRDW